MRKFVASEAFPSSCAHGVFKISTVKPKVFDDGSRRIRFCFSDGAVDRMNDRIDARGWELDSFNRNPVALWAHDSAQPPIGRASNVRVEGDRLMGTIEFAEPETYAFADTIYRLVRGGFINAVSVGFLPLEYAYVDDKDRPWGIDFKRQELLEISVCPVPANPNSLVEAGSKGINMRPLSRWAARALHRGGRGTMLTRAELEQLREEVEAPASVASLRRSRDLAKALNWRIRTALTRRITAADRAAEFDALLAQRAADAAEAQQRQDRARVLDAALRLAAW